jgi:hypothetical protein
LKWPAALQAESFANDRAAMEAAIPRINDQRYVSVSQSTEDFSQTVKALRAKLTKQKDAIRPSEYAYAKSFLDRLSNETRIASNFALNF